MFLIPPFLTAAKYFGRGRGEIDRNDGALSLSEPQKEKRHRCQNTYYGGGALALFLPSEGGGLRTSYSLPQNWLLSKLKNVIR